MRKLVIALTATLALAGAAFGQTLTVWTTFQDQTLDWLREQGQIADAEMHRVFNCGIGMVLVLSPADADRAIARLEAAGEQAWRIGEVLDRHPGDAPAIVR